MMDDHYDHNGRLMDERDDEPEPTPPTYNGLYFIYCDTDGRGRRWRLAKVEEVAGLDGSCLWATFIDGGEAEDDLAVFRKNGSRIVGPFSVMQLLVCIEIAEYVAVSDPGFLPQVKPGERPIKAARANGLAKAAERFMAANPGWRRENF